MDRELTPADFEAKHKFSFDMYASIPQVCWHTWLSLTFGFDLEPAMN
jgi:hypothetical protein